MRIASWSSHFWCFDGAGRVDPNLLSPWTAFGVFMLETALLLAAAYVVVRRRDA